jgi:membrane fusion protein, multidrug efflux system
MSRVLNAWLVAALCAASGAALAQPAPPRAPAVGIVKVVRTPIYQSSSYVGRIQAINRVNLVARVTAFIEKSFFTEGAEVKAGDLLYRLEQGPFQADLQAKEAQAAQFRAQLQNAMLTLQRQQSLLQTPAGQQSTVDAALAAQQSLQAQIAAAEAQIRMSQISLDYTEIHAPIDGKIGRTSLTVGNVVTPNSGVLASIVSQDPIYVTFPIPVRSAFDLRARFADKGGFKAVVLKLRLPDGRLYEQAGKLDFLDNTIAGTTDTITLRGEIPNPPLQGDRAGTFLTRELVDNELVTVVLEDAQPVEALTVPRSAVLTDQEGDYLYVVDGDSRAQQRRVTLGQSSPLVAVVTKGVAEGDSVIVDGIQRVRPGQPVAPGPAAPSPAPAPPR